MNQPPPPEQPTRRTLNRDYRTLTPAERSLWRYPIMWAAAAAFLFVPLIYVGVYLMSVWDPAGNLPDLPAALVNLDQGTVSRGKQVNVGRELLTELHKDPPVQFRHYPTQAQAEAAVRRGDVYFALTIPADFSRRAVSGSSSEHGLLQLYRAPGLNYYASTVSDRVASAIAEDLNATLGENRWEVVQNSLADVQQGFLDLHDATSRLADGAQTLLDGSGRLASGAATLAGGTTSLASGAGKLAGGARDLSAGVGRLSSGVSTLSGGLRQLEAAAPGEKQLAPLRSGAATLSTSAGSLATGLGKLASGGDQLAAGARKLGSGATQVDTGTSQLAAQLPALAGGLGDLNGGAQALATGAERLSGGLGKAQAGAKQASDGAAQLATGLGKLDTGLGTLQTGAQSLASGAASLGSALKGSPAAQGAQTLQTGAASLATGLEQSKAASAATSRGAQTLATQLPALSSGLGDLNSGATQLQAGAAKLAAGTASAQSGAQKAATGARQLAAGTTQLRSGAQDLATGAGTLAANTRKAAAGATQLAAGAGRLQSGVNTLVSGNLKIKSALGQITARLPAQQDLGALSSGSRTLASSSEQLAAGARRLATGAGTLRAGTTDLQSGARQLRDGLVTLRDKIPTDTEQLGGDPDGLARSVTVHTEDFANVPNNGNAFAPYFIALALWVGATLTTFIFPFLLIPDSGRHTGQVARVLRKLSVPLLIVAGQAGIVVLGVHLMGVQFMNPTQVLLTSLAGSVTFMTVILALNLLFGPAGRVLALILLIVQLAASGGSYPVELSSPVFQAIHNLIPVTEVINALRHAMFGAFEGQYWDFMGRMGLVALIGFIVALLSRRRWVYTPDDRFRSPILTDVG
ncbi:YhgE/Pip domain-containing protein [Deinococcus depolymerans]|uniref:ABC-2 type transporter transmembrane domain-containing protein n=1 Tax=Deinococcus depolymerans TaxID=392408 RepID=A0ABN1CMG9_9DEIO